MFFSKKESSESKFSMIKFAFKAILDIISIVEIYYFTKYIIKKSKDLYKKYFKFLIAYIYKKNEDE